MSKTGFCSGWSCLYLTPAPRWFVGVEDCFCVVLVVDLLALLLLVSLMPLGYVAIWAGWTAVAVLPVLVFLVNLPWWIAADELLEFWRWKRLYMNLSWLSWSTAVPVTTWWLSLCVCCCCACTLAVWAASVCVCVLVLGTWAVRGSARQLDHIPFISFIC
jgi:hypothetical protein